MTLIVTQISRKGIVHACDSLVTFPGRYGPERTEERQKLFTMPTLHAALTVAGLYSSKGFVMDAWMKAFIQDQERGGVLDLRDFSHELKDRLEDELQPDAKRHGCMVHIAGYADGETHPHPEFWFVRNVHGMNSRGEYERVDESFEVSEDFWTRDYKNDYRTKKAINNGGFQLYANGSPKGRTAFMTLGPMLGTVLFHEFLRPNFAGTHTPVDLIVYYPKSVEDFESSLREAMVLISRKLPDPVIGGEVRSHSIREPPNCTW